MANPKLILTLLPPPLSIDHAVLFTMGQEGFADSRQVTRDGRPVRPSFERPEATRAIRLALSSALSRLSDAGLRARITQLLGANRRLHADELRPSEQALKRVHEHDPDAARAIGALAVCRVIAPVDRIPVGHAVRALSGRVLLVDVNLIAALGEIAEPAEADAPGPLRELLLDNFGTACVLHLDGVAIAPPRPVIPVGRAAKPDLRLVVTDA